MSKPEFTLEEKIAMALVGGVMAVIGVFVFLAWLLPTDRTGGLGILLALVLWLYFMVWRHGRQEAKDDIKRWLRQHGWHLTTIVLTVAAIGAGFWVPVLLSNAPFLAGMQ